MTKEEIKALINAKLAGQGNQVDLGSALPTILNEIVDMAGGDEEITLELGEVDFDGNRAISADNLTNGIWNKIFGHNLPSTIREILVDLSKMPKVYVAPFKVLNFGGDGEDYNGYCTGWVLSSSLTDDGGSIEIVDPTDHSHNIELYTL